MKKLVVSLGAFLLATPVWADGIHTRDLGEGGTGAECLARAERAIRAYARNHSGPNTVINSGDWSAHGFDLQPGDVDVQIACPYRNNISSIVLLFSHSRGEQADREAVIDGINDAWHADNGGAPSK